MNEDQKFRSLGQLLDRMDEICRTCQRISLGEILEVVGPRSFGPFLLLAGLITLAPIIGDIPGVPTLIGITVFLIAIQLLVGRKRFWLPGWLRKRSVAGDKFRRGLEMVRRPAGFIDRFLRARLTFLTGGPMTRIIAVLCLLIAAVMPPMELVPFSANVAGAALTVFGLALIARDGLLILFAFAFTGLAVTLVAVHVG